MSAVLSPRADTVMARGAQALSMSDVASQSWARCIEAHGLRPDGRPRPLCYDGALLAERQARLSDLVACARHEMTTLFQQLADPFSTVVLTDTDGMIVHMVASPEFGRDLDDMGFRVGAVWSEAQAGTNGMGTCLAANRAVTIHREEHFFPPFRSLTCAAVPLVNAEGRPAGVLDVTSRSLMPQQHVLVLLDMTARMIENRLLDRSFPHACPVHFHTRPEFIHTLHEGRLAVAPDGQILAVNRSALFQLGRTAAMDLIGMRLDEVFETSLDDLIERSAQASFHPVVTFKVSGSNRYFALARRPAGVEPSSATSRRALAPRDDSSSASASHPHATVGQKLGDPRLMGHWQTACKVIKKGIPVLLHGETGSGKEVFARLVHEHSPHASGEFVAVNCASIPESLIEAELFGYRAGAFTGAQRSGRRGKVLQADKGTLFLDEIGDMPLDLQARLLRVLDERRVTPLGSEEAQDVSFQLLSASHRDLAELVAQGRFREDLYYRLNGIELSLPALRERSDRRALILGILAEEAGAEVRLSAEADALLMGYAWPGNVRQLRHVLRTAVALMDGVTVLPEHLPFLQRQMAATCQPGGLVWAAPTEAMPAGGVTQEDAAGAMDVDADADEDIMATLNPVQLGEREALLKLIEQHRWNVSRVAKVLGISRNTLYRKLHRLGIPVAS